jgi:hypothetical protein
VNTNDTTNDIINAIDKLHMGQKKEYSDEKNLESSHNPVSELITPEWHYSESIKLLDSIQISWNNLGECNLIQTIADSLDKAKIPDNIVGGEFERSFCSWYQPYHYLPREKWGIHIRYDSLMRIASLFYHDCPSLVNIKLDSVKSGFLYLFVHELFHHIVENAASIIEIVSSRSHIYTKYYNNVYLEVFNSSNCIEEALSNGYLFLWAEVCRIDRDFLKERLSSQGPGYHNFIQYIGSNFFEGNRILISQIRHGNLKPTIYDPIEQILDTSNPIQYSYIHNVPIWLHRKAKPVY